MIHKLNLYRIQFATYLIVGFFLLQSCSQQGIDQSEINKELKGNPVPIALEGKYSVNPMTGDSVALPVNKEGIHISTGISLQLDWKTIIFDKEKIRVSNPEIHSPKYPTTSVASRWRDIEIESEMINAEDIVVDTIALKIEKMAVRHPAPFQSPDPKYADINPLNIQSIGIEHGLKSLLIWGSIEDHLGNIWMVSEGGGISRYDGHQVITFTVKEGLTTEVLLSIFIDSENHIWFGGWGGNPMKYDGEYFYEVFLTADGQPVQVNNFAEMEDGSIYISSANTGIFILKNDQVQHIKSLPVIGNVENFQTDPQGGIWIGGEKGVVHQQKNQYLAYTFPDKMHNYGATPSLVDHKGRTWFVSWGYGLVKLEEGKWSECTIEDGLINNRVMDIKEDLSNQIWIGSQGGLQKWKNDQYENITMESGLPISDVYGILVDSQNNLWLSLSGGGMARLSQDGISNLTTHNYLPHDQLSFITEHDDGQKAIGFWGNGLMYETTDGIQLIKEQNGLRTNYVLNMHGAKDQVYFQDFYGMGSYDGTDLNYYNTSGGPYVTYNYLVRRDGNLWLGTREYGLIKKEGEVFNQLLLPGVDPGGTYPLLEDKEGDLWVGMNEMLAVISESEVTYYSQPEGFFNDLPIQRLTQDSKGNIWIATKLGGLFKFDFESFIEVVAADQAQDGDVYVKVDNQDNVWLMLPYQLLVINELDGAFKIRPFSKSNGLKNYELSSIHYSQDNKMYVGGRDGGIDIFDLSEFTLSSSTPSVYIQSISINGNPIDFRSLEAEDSTRFPFTKVLPYSNVPQDLTLSSKDNHVAFNYAGIDWSGQKDIRYQYQLSPMEKNWSALTNESTIDYRNLPYGDLNFKVKAIGKNQEWSDIASFEFKVNPPWWQSIQALIMYGLGLVLFIFLITQWRTRSLRKRQELMEQEIKEATAEISKQKEKAEQSEKYKEQFLANMSHEIRTPLNAIMGMTKIMKRKDHPAHQDQLLDVMTQSSKNLSVLLNDILDLSKIEAGKIEVVHTAFNLKDIVDQVNYLLKIKAEKKGIALVSRMDKELPALIMGDPHRLSQILINLVNNAIKFSEEGIVNVEIMKAEDKINFSVKDRGIGIEKAEFDHIFGSFTQSKSPSKIHQKGTGLGLKIAKHLIELQGGKIWVESEVGIGSTFYFDLPLIEADGPIQPTLPKESDLKELGKSLQGLRILLAEDDPFNQMIAQDELEWYIPAVEIAIASDGELALEFWTKGKFDLIITDIQMPKISGYELAQKIRSIESGGPNDNDTPILAMTASVISKDIEKIYAAGMDGYIPKPFQSHEFIGAIHQLFREQLPHSS